MKIEAPPKIETPLEIETTLEFETTLEIETRLVVRRGLALLALSLAACAATPRPTGPVSTPPTPRSDEAPLIRLDSLLGGGASAAPTAVPVHVGAARGVAASSGPRSALAGISHAVVRGDRTTLAGKVNSIRLASLKLDGAESVREVMRFISAASGIDIFVDQHAEDAVLGAGIEFNVRRERPISVENALNLLVLMAEREIAWTIRDGVVVVTTPDRARGAPRTVVYDVSDLVRGITSYPGRRMDLAPSGGLTPHDEDQGEPVSVIGDDMLIQLIMDTIDPDGWDRPGNSVTIRDGKLIVTHD